MLFFPSADPRTRPSADPRESMTWKLTSVRAPWWGGEVTRTEIETGGDGMVGRGIDYFTTLSDAGIENEIHIIKSFPSIYAL